MTITSKNAWKIKLREKIPPLIIAKEDKIVQEVIFCDVSPVAMFDIDNLLNFTDTIADQEETLEKMFERSKFPYIICEPHQHSSSSSSLVQRILSF